MKFKHFSFDLDGTLIDSVPVMEKAWKEVQEKLGLEVPFCEYKAQIGIPFPEIIKRLGLCNLSDEIAKTYFASTQHNVNLIQLYPDVLDTFQELRHRGHLISIITSKPKQHTEKLLQKFGLVCDYFVCGDDKQYGKPDRRLMQETNKRLGCSTAETVYIGDTIHDLLFSLNSETQFRLITRPNGLPFPSNILNNVVRIRELSTLLS